MGVYPIPHDSLLDLTFALMAFAATPLLLYIRLLRRRLAQARARLTMVMDNMHDGLIVLNPDRTIELVNSRGSELVAVPDKRVPYDEVLAQFEAFRTTGDPIPTSEWPSIRALRGDFVKNFIIIYRDKRTGHVGSREITTAPVPPGAGKPGQIVISYRDDSERRHVDIARARLASIVESSSDAIISTDLFGIVTTWNSAATAITGYTREEMIGYNVGKMLPAGGHNYLEPILRRVARGETIPRFQADRSHKSGRPIRVEVSLSPLHDINREVIGISSILHDITETHHLQHQLQEFHKMQALGQLAGGFAHDFNNLLAIIMGNLELLQSEHGHHPITLRRIRTATTAAIRGAGLIRHLLAFSSNEHLSPVPTVLREILSRSIRLATRNFSTSIRTATLIDPDLPPILVDPAGLQNALTNLIANARDAMPDGGILSIEASPIEFTSTSPEVTSHRLAAGHYVHIRIADNGQGMDAATLERAFEPFFTTRQRSRGTGLGLAAVYGFARQSGGSVHIESQPGAGATVSLFLPFIEASAFPNPALPFPTTASNSTMNPSPGATAIQSILLVDDEGDLLHLIADFLTRVGYSVLTARSPEDALRKAAGNPAIDLLITDIEFTHGGDGVTLAETIHTRNPATQILYTSGLQPESLAERGLHINPHTLIPKPYRLDQLHNAIRTLTATTPCESAA